MKRNPAAITKQNIVLPLLILGSAGVAVAEPRLGKVEHSYCPVASSQLVHDRSIKRCDSLVRELRGPVRDQVLRVSGQLSELAAHHTEITRQGGTDCTGIVQSAVGSNTAGSGTLSAAESALTKIRSFLEGKEKNFAETIKKIKDPQTTDSSIFSQEARPNAVILKKSLLQEHQRGHDLVNGYLAQVNTNHKGASQTRAKLAKLSTGTGKVSCDSLGQVLKDPQGAVSAARQAIDSRALQDAPEDSSLDVLGAGGSGSNLGNVLGDVPPNPFLEPNVYTEKNGTKVFVTKQSTTDGKTVYMGVLEDKNGIQFVTPINKQQYEDFLANNGKEPGLKADAKDIFLNGVTPTRFSGAKLVPGVTEGTYKGGETDLPWFAGGAAPPSIDGEKFDKIPPADAPISSAELAAANAPGRNSGAGAPAGGGVAPPHSATQPPAPDNVSRFVGGGHVRHPAIKNDPGQCISLVVAAAPDIPKFTSQWQQGAPISQGNLPPVGTPIATFQSGKYWDDTTGKSHAAIFAGTYPGGIWVFDQYAGAGGVPRMRQIPWQSGPGSTVIKSAANYSVIQGQNRQVATSR